jgi:hypothetical protein
MPLDEIGGSVESRGCTRLDLRLVTPPRENDGLSSMPLWGFFYPRRIGVYRTLTHLNTDLPKINMGHTWNVLPSWT